MREADLSDRGSGSRAMAEADALEGSVEDRAGVRL